MNPQALTKFLPSDADSWLWQTAQYQDIDEMVALARSHFQCEMDTMFTINEPGYKYALDIATSHQRHTLAQEQLLVCRDKLSNQLLAYSWIGRGHRTPYSNDEMAEARMLHIDLALASRQRVHLTVQALYHWYNWTRACGIPILVSTSIRADQQAFLRIHERLGFMVRGGIAYLRVIPKEQQ